MNAPHSWETPNHIALEDIPLLGRERRFVRPGLFKKPRMEPPFSLPCGAILVSNIPHFQMPPLYRRYLQH
jgi:hypothetical protein